MKKSLLVLSAASLAASSAVAGSYITTAVDAKDPCTVAKALVAGAPAKCAPQVTFYITGATAQAGYMTGTALPDKWFETGYFTILEGDGATAAAPSTRKADSSARGWYGIGKAGTAAAGKRLYVAYNPKGSIEGVMQVMSPTATEPEATVFFPGHAGCVVSSTSSLTYYCGGAVGTGYKAIETDIALSDVKPQEGDLVWMKAANNGKTLPKFDSTALLSTPVGLQAFALIVNNAFYKALQDRDIARGYIPASCSSEGSAGTYAASAVTSACRPTMARHEYASLIAANGAKDLTAILGASAAASRVVVDRRYGGSGTQASSNIYFLNNPCGGRGLASATSAATDGLGLNITTADAVVTGTYGGGLIPRSGTAVTTDPSAAVTGTAYGNISVVEWTSSSSTALKSSYGVGSTTDYHIGVASANADDGATWKYLKLDGVDPIGTAAGAKAVAPFTDNLRNGLYPFSMVFYTVMTQAAYKKKSTDTLAKLADDLTTTLKVPNVNLNGIAALPENSASALSTMKGILSRAGNNNCAPLKVTTN